MTIRSGARPWGMLVHHLNILLHVAAGLAAMAMGLLVMARAKGTADHRRLGKLYYSAFSLVLGSAAAGLVFFRPDPTLLAVVLLSAYLLWSGWRAVKLKGDPPSLADMAAAGFAAAAGVAFFTLVLAGAGLLWQPTATAPIAGALVGWGLLDLGWSIAPAEWRLRFWRLEHGVKLVSSLTGLLSAGAGTALAAYKPWSQVGPSIVMTLFLVGYLAAFHRRHAPSLD